MSHAAEGSTASRGGSTAEGRVRSPDAAPSFDLFHTGHMDEAKALVKAHHYSGLTPNNVVVVGTIHEPGGLFGDSGPVMAACFFGQPPARWSEPVLELVRLVRTPDCAVPLSVLVGRTCSHIKTKRMADLLVSMADPTHDHHGGIYQACSWKFGGQRRRRMDGVTVNGQFYAGRAANHHWGTQSPARLQSIGVDAQPHYDEGKFVYWRALSRSGQRKADRLGLLQLPYPKPDEVAA